MKFERLTLHVDLLKGVAKAGFERCTPVQEQSLPETLAGKDIITQAQTGTGKTAVYLLSILNKLITEGKVTRNPSALIMVPTRELAIQVDKDAKTLGKYLPFRSLAVYGGVGYEKQHAELSRGVDIIAATPGRMIDLYKSKTLSLSSIDQFVIDEADRMFDMGFVPDIQYIASHLPKNKSKQTMLFSATIDDRVITLASKFMRPDPVLIEIEPEQVTVDLIDQRLVHVANEEKLSVLMGLLNRPEFERVIIFTNMKRTAERLSWKLVGNGFPAKVITGDVAQSKRQKTIDNMKSGTIRILVATEVAARGLHIDGISHVINYDLPSDAANYVHRIGRTARAGKTGIAYSLVCEDHVLNLPKIESFIDCKIKIEGVDESEMVKDRAGSYSRKSVAAPHEKKEHTRRKLPGKDTSYDASRNRSGQKKVIHKKDSIPRNKLSPPNKRKSLPSSEQDRIDYYKKKYGENFVLSKSEKGQSPVKTEVAAVPGKSRGVLKKLFGNFGKKKKTP